MKDFYTDAEFNTLMQQGMVQDVPGSSSNTPDFLTDEEMARLEGKASNYAVQESPVARANKISQYQNEAQQDKAESQRANSVGGFLGNFGKAVVSNIASSEVGLGKTIAKTFGNQRDVYTDTIDRTSGTQANLAKLIREKEARGEDTTKLRQLFNELGKDRDELMSGFKEENELPTTGQVAGQLGGTALDLLTAGTYGKAATAMKSGSLAQKTIPFLPKPIANTAARTIFPEVTKVAEIASKPTGILTKKGGTKVLEGAGIGYGYDVTQGLQGNRGEERDGAQAFIPGLGTVIGAGIPVATETAQSFANKFQPETKAQILVNNRLQELNKLDRLQTVKKAVEKGRERGIDVKKILSETDVLHGSVDNTGKISTKGEGGAVDVYRKTYVDGNEAIVSQALKKEGVAISPETVYVKLRQSVMDSGIQGAELDKALGKLDREMAGYSRKATANGTIPTYILHDAKVDKYSNINFMTDPSKQKYDKTVAKALKELVEDNTQSIDVKAVNRELSKHFAVMGYLEKLDGRVVEGGKLGKYFASTIGTMLGGALGSAGGPAGAFAGGIVGSELGSRVKGNLMSRVFQGKTGKVAPQAEVITDAKKYLEKPALQLPGKVQETSSSLNNRGNRQIIQAIPKTTTITESIPKFIPRPKNQVNKGFSTPDLVQEARKYKSAEEFVKYHKTGSIPSGTYDDSLSSLRESNLLKKENNPIRVGEVNGYEIRESGKPNKYTKTDGKGNIVRDKEGNATFLSSSEMRVKRLPETDTTIVAYDGETPIGYVMDSFGSPEVVVAKDYQGKGIGTGLLEKWLLKFPPGKKIGQMTPEGEAMTRSLYKKLYNKAVGKRKIPFLPKKKKK